MPPRLPVLPVDVAVASRYGAIRSDLARVGRTVADLDLLIAATALTHGLAVVTRNVRHFGRIPKIELADWFGSTG
ncbi:MAG: type II toxin-antitoxin system VapC family toxin [Deltaproteobacteria bacterium]|nr:type II toxin-antitoxin system VapC family toxin [Deltaproteobacteria bacterium]